MDVRTLKSILGVMRENGCMVLQFENEKHGKVHIQLDPRATLAETKSAGPAVPLHMRKSPDEKVEMLRQTGMLPGSVRDLKAEARRKKSSGF